MLRVSIRATPDTDVGAETENLRQIAAKAGLEPVVIDRIAHETETVVRNFVDRGRQLRSFGSQLKAERVIEGDSHEIRVRFDTVQRVGLLGRILAAFRR